MTADIRFWRPGGRGRGRKNEQLLADRDTPVRLLPLPGDILRVVIYSTPLSLSLFLSASFYFRACFFSGSRPFYLATPFPPLFPSLPPPLSVSLSSCCTIFFIRYVAARLSKRALRDSSPSPSYAYLPRFVVSQPLHRALVFIFFFLFFIFSVATDGYLFEHSETA